MESAVTFILGILFICIGISNRKGNISTLHSYHRKRVSEEDILPFGKMVGIGMIIIGVAMVLMGVLSFMASRLNNDIYLIAGTVVLIVSLVVGLVIIFWAMFKYNKGIF